MVGAFTFQTYYCGSGYGTPVRKARRPTTIPYPSHTDQDLKYVNDTLTGFAVAHNCLGEVMGVRSVVLRLIV